MMLFKFRLLYIKRKSRFLCLLVALLNSIFIDVEDCVFILKKMILKNAKWIVMLKLVILELEYFIVWLIQF